MDHQGLFLRCRGSELPGNASQKRKKSSFFSGITVCKPDIEASPGAYRDGVDDVDAAAVLRGGADGSRDAAEDSGHRGLNDFARHGRRVGHLRAVVAKQIQLHSSTQSNRNWQQLNEGN